MVDDPRLLRRDIARLQATVKRLATAMTANPAVAALSQAIAAVNAKTQRQAVTVGPLGIGSTDILITWPTPWPDTSYAVVPTIVSGTGALGSLTATLKVGSKTTDNCVVTVANTGLAAIGSFAVDVIGIRT